MTDQYFATTGLPKRQLTRAIAISTSRWMSSSCFKCGDIASELCPPRNNRGYSRPVVSPHPLASIASSTRGGDIGRLYKRMPSALWMALAIAASGGTIGTSPTPLHAVRMTRVGHFDDHRVDHRQVRATGMR